MRDRPDFNPGDLVEVVNASSLKGEQKPSFLVGQVMRVHFVTADKSSICVAGHNGLWRATRFKPAT